MALILILETAADSLGHPRGRASIAALAAVALIGSACGAGDNRGANAEEPGESRARVSVVASVYPLVEAAGQVGGVRVDVVSLTPAGSEPHDLELTPRDVDALEDADVVLYLGEGFQPAVEELAERRDGATVDLLEGKPLRAPPGDTDEHQDESDHPAEDGPDPHVWLDPILMIQMVGQISEALSEVDPAGADAYERHATRFVEELEELHADLESGLADCRSRTIVTSHAAFGYLAARYGLDQESISGLSPEAEPDPERLDELTELVEREGISTIFTETLVAPEVAETLAREAGVRTALLNPLEGLSAEELAAGGDYPSVMRKNLAALREALGCA